MRNKYYQDDEFEQFLQDEVKQHRMYPSDHIWKNIRTQVHGYRAWPALTFISLFIITALTLSTLLNNHPDHHNLPALMEEMVAKKTAPTNTSNVAESIIDETEEKNKQYFLQITPEQITAETFSDLKQDGTGAGTLGNYNTNASANENSVVANHTIPVTDKATDKYYRFQTTPNTELTALSNPALQLTANTNIETDEELKKNNAITLDNDAEQIEEVKAKQQKEAHTSVDEFLKDFSYIKNTPTARKNTKFGFQFYATPSTSYRRLSDEKVKDIIQPAAAAAQNLPLSANNTANVNEVVRHKPAMGLELGFGILYNISGKFKFKTGLQLNIRQYYIETFESRTNDLTSVALINRKGIETINFYSPYNNNTGYRKTQLDNKVYQLSIPIGVVWDVVKGKHLGISAEGSVQPTFALNTNTYLLSTDYKHYTDGHDFIRKWNINTSAGFNITYQQGAYSYMIGPQIRYQHLPTYSNLYPVKEYLIDYGIRLGITRQIK